MPNQYGPYRRSTYQWQEIAWQAGGREDNLTISVQLLSHQYLVVERSVFYGTFTDIAPRKLRMSNLTS